MSKVYNFCNNCGKTGHSFHQCKLPITSIGVISFKESDKGIQYLMIRRKDTLGYVDFLLSKFGSIDDIRSLSMSSLSSSWIKDKKLSLLDLPKSPIFTPVKTISFMPELFN